MLYSSPVLWDDLNFFWDFAIRNKWEPYIENNKVSIPKQSQPSLCFVTFETRGERDEYVRLHNHNIRAYVDYQNSKSEKKRYTYRFLTTCQSNINHPHNVYWCKFFCFQNILEEAQYDYIVFLDSDTVINDFELDFAKLLAGYESDWFVGMDKHFDFRDIGNLNAGVVIVRNSKMGNKIIDTIIDTYNDDNFQIKCINENKKLTGFWAGVCYEQGVMIQILFDRFRKYLTVFPPNIIHNGRKCEGKFIVHLFASSAEDRAKCFRKYTSQLITHSTNDTDIRQDLQEMIDDIGIV
jgi:hypothetical protein